MAAIHVIETDQSVWPRKDEATSEVRHPLRAPDAEALERGPGAQDLPRGAGPDRAGGPGGVRLRVGGGAPLPALCGSASCAGWPPPGTPPAPTSANTPSGS